MPVFKLTSHAKTDLYRKLPSVGEFLRSDAATALAARTGQIAVTNAARRILNRLRAQVTDGDLSAESLEQALSQLDATLEEEVQRSLTYSLRRVINATGVILHTNLGRAPLYLAALDHIRNTAAGYSNLEFDTDAGERGKRDKHVDRLFHQLLHRDPGADGASNHKSISTIIVNNNAAAVLLALNSFAENGEVIVSRGELVEIGGSFRIPEIMAKSNAVLREVGTTNRTSLGDYESAINENTRLLLRVHRSNFAISGFTQQPRLEELASLARRRKIPLMEDLGSGSLFDLRSIGIHEEPGVLDSLRGGVNVVTYSGDKLLGGPQAGIISGDRDLISRLRANSLFRALRASKLIYAALEATLLAYLRHDYDSIPALRMMRLSRPDIAKRAEAVANKIRSSRIKFQLMDGNSVIGGGAAPSAVLATCLLVLTSETLSCEEIVDRLGRSDSPIIARVEEDRVVLDLRTVFPEEDDQIVDAINTVLS